MPWVFLLTVCHQNSTQHMLKFVFHVVASTKTVKSHKFAILRGVHSSARVVTWDDGRNHRCSATKILSLTRVITDPTLFDLQQFGWKLCIC